MSEMGRPPKINPEICERIIDAISHNIPYQLAAEANDICESTLYLWLQKGKEDRIAGIESEHRNFLESVKDTELQKIHKLSESIEYQSERWQAAAWLLERRWRQFFGQDAGIIQELQTTFNELKAKMEAK